MRAGGVFIVFVLLVSLGVTFAYAQPSYSWRYYRPGNTGIQGDYNEAVWVAPDGDPYIGGYDPTFEEGGFAKFVQSENRWLNYSNVDYPVIGHPENTGTPRVTDFVPEIGGKLWIATWRGALRFDPALGGNSLERFGPGNSQLVDDMVFDADRAPDGTIWFVNQGIVRYSPATDTWMRWNVGNTTVGAQPKPTGGYLVWSSSTPPIQDLTFVFDSDTQQWTTYTWQPQGPAGQIVGMPGQDCVDDSGNLWALRTNAPGDWNSLDYRRPDGTWVTPPEPYPALPFYVCAFKAHGDGRALAVDESGQVFQFDGSSWSSAGVWRSGPNTYSIDIDAAGNIWVCGIGGAARRDAVTGQWQRYRITNTGNCDSFNGDLAIDTANNVVYTTANATAGVGGMASFDGARWTGWNQLTYGLGHDWPFANDNCQALTYRPSNGHLTVSPSDWLYGVHDWTGSGFVQLPGLDGAKRLTEDSQARVWAIGEYFSLNYYDGSAWNNVPIVGWGGTIQKDPTTPGTVWAATGHEVNRTDGVDSFSRGIGDFPELATISDTFSGLAAAPGGIAWIGATVQFGGGGTGGALIRLDATNGTYQMLRYDQGWPLPGQYVQPLAVTPDGRVWMQYDSDYLVAQRGLCWYDGTDVGVFPAPPGGEPQWGSLPHAAIADLEVREIEGGYELWMTRVSRGIAVLTVQMQSPTATGPGEVPLATALQPNYPNPFNPSTSIAFTLARDEWARVSVYALTGTRVAVLADGPLRAGEHTLQWDGRNSAGQTMPSGTYVARLESASTVQSRKMTLLR